MSLETNDQLILVSGFSGTGKSASLRNIRNQEKWLYLNTEAGKRLPFRNSFQHGRITDPYQVTDAFTYAIENPNDVDGIIVDSLTFMMDMYESMYVLNAANTMAAWSNFAQFFKYLMQDRVILFGKPVIFTAHVKDDLDEKNMEIKTAVPIKGSLKNNGIEAYFSSVVATKKMTLKDLEIGATLDRKGLIVRGPVLDDLDIVLAEAPKEVAASKTSADKGKKPAKPVQTPSWG